MRSTHGPLVYAYLFLCCAEGRPAVIVIPEVSSMWKVMVFVPDLRWLPRFIQQLVDAGAFVERVMPECGVVSALVPGHRAHLIAREAAAFGTKRTRETGEGGKRGN